MRKHENVDIIDTLNAVMESNTAHYQSDFQYDKEMFVEAATSPTFENSHLLWLSRPSGTECFYERSAHIAETAAHNSWCYYADTKDNILAYAVEITGMEKGKPIGNLYELDYQNQVAQLKRDALPPTEVTLILANGDEKQFPHEQYKNNWMGLKDKFGKIDRVRFEVADEGSLTQSLKNTHADRQKYKAAVFKVKTTSRKPSIRSQLAEGKEKSTAKQWGSFCYWLYCTEALIYFPLFAGLLVQRRRYAILSLAKAVLLKRY